MTDINISKTHELTLSEAKVAAQKVADRMAAEFDVQSEWKGNVLAFQRSGVEGTLTITDRQAVLEIRLGMFYKMFSAAISEGAERAMKKAFSHPLTIA